MDCDLTPSSALCWRPAIGVVVVTYNSAEVIGGCLASLLGTAAPGLAIVVCDNGSQDDTLCVVRAVGAGAGPRHSLTLVAIGRNLGFAAAVNVGLDRLAADPGLDLFWILNPDCEVLPGTAGAYLAAARAARRFGLMGGRTLYRAPPNRIQSDGGCVNRWTGVCRGANVGLDPVRAVAPSGDSLDYVSGANLVVSRAFLERAGPMPEDYFLYYEEVAWARRRGSLALVVAPGAVVLHHGGTAIGSGAVDRRPSAFANYFNYRNRMRFLCRHAPWALPTAWGYALARIAHLAGLGAWDEAGAALRGLTGLAPPAAVRDRLSPDVHDLAFGSPVVNVGAAVRPR